ncbi:hypothetical protein J4410_05795 [Candidatus Woesearchaeota archaeon]|nr:hypothetical protein [Candidatus Woesearchaeota archaeon]
MKSNFKLFKILILFLLVLYLIGALAQMKWHPLDALNFWMRVLGIG